MKRNRRGFTGFEILSNTVRKLLDRNKMKGSILIFYFKMFRKLKKKIFYEKCNYVLYLCKHFHTAATLIIVKYMHHMLDPASGCRYK